MQPHGAISRAGLLIGLGLLAIAGVIAFDAMGMRVPPIHAKVGPRFFPLLVAGGLALCGAALLWQGLKGRFTGGDGEEESDWTAVVIICAGLIVHMNILRPLGFVPAATVLFLSVTYAFGSRRFLRDGVAALVIALIAYIGFTRFLGLQLPAGILSGVL